MYVAFQNSSVCRRFGSWPALELMMIVRDIFSISATLNVDNPGAFNLFLMISAMKSSNSQGNFDILPRSPVRHLRQDVYLMLWWVCWIPWLRPEAWGGRPLALQSILRWAYFKLYMFYSSSNWCGRGNFVGNCENFRCVLKFLRPMLRSREFRPVSSCGSH